MSFNLSNSSLNQASRAMPLSNAGLKTRGVGNDSFGVGSHIFASDNNIR